MRTVMVMVILMTAMTACEFDESGLEWTKMPYAGMDGGQPAAQVEQTQQRVDTTGLPPRIPPGATLCDPQNPDATALSKHGRVWVRANGINWCVQLQLGNYANIATWGWDNRVMAARPGGCSDILLGEHPNWGGAVNHIWDDRWTTWLSPAWQGAVSSIAVRPLLVNPWGQPCN